MAHLLDGCWAKLNRAEESIAGLDGEATAFFATDPPPFNIVQEHRGRDYVFLAYGDPEVPLRFAVLAGEIIHHLRSSLDHLVHTLVIQRGSIPTRKHQFPICSTQENFDKACDKGALKYISPSARRKIAAVQPFTQAVPQNTVLSVINECDNCDKHRLLVVVTTVVRVGQEIRVGVSDKVDESADRKGKAPAITNLGDISAKKIDKEGVEFFSIRLEKPFPEFFASTNVVPQLAFDKCGHVQLAPVVRTLTGLLAGTRNTIKSFLSEF
jgi:hypothetical protein